MSTDRELLELAARAAGYQIEWVRNSGCHYRCEEEIGREAWCPLDDDGDALRLAVRLDINLYNPGSHPAALHRTEDASTFYESGCARRSIVLAAAAIGRNLP
ncbi:hypothetical protein [Pseudomonas sp. LA5]|uniref:hypothetical protein n=1 Tax=Pseudomonas sp. LA5 TaxID=3027850 RepID=UPI00235DFD90|nr:hypothetical protein [Pseudomonas sp. LA5]